MHKAEIISDLCFISGHLNGIAWGLKQSTDPNMDIVKMLENDSEKLVAIVAELNKILGVDKEEQ